MGGDSTIATGCDYRVALRIAKFVRFTHDLGA
jgi:hypothetical protein